MIQATTVRRVCLIRDRVDFRLGHDGLLGESYRRGLLPYEGDLVIFVGRRLDRLKLLLFDGSGLWVLYKKFKGRSLRQQFRFLSDGTTSTLSLAEVGLLLEGARYTIHN
jgi:transposase